MKPRLATCMSRERGHGATPCIDGVFPGWDGERKCDVPQALWLVTPSGVAPVSERKALVSHAGRQLTIRSSGLPSPCSAPSPLLCWGSILLGVVTHPDVTGLKSSLGVTPWASQELHLPVPQSCLHPAAFPRAWLTTFPAKKPLCEPVG